MLDRFVVQPHQVIGLIHRIYLQFHLVPFQLPSQQMVQPVQRQQLIGLQQQLNGK